MQMRRIGVRHGSPLASTATSPRSDRLEGVDQDRNGEYENQQYKVTVGAGVVAVPCRYVRSRRFPLLLVQPICSRLHV
jgi:hypothetical protein